MPAHFKLLRRGFQCTHRLQNRMPFAISVKATNSTAQAIRDLWDQVSPFEDSPSMTALNYPPHITFAVYDRIDVDRLRAALRKTFAKQSSLRIVFDRIRYFDGPPLVLWAAPAETSTLLNLHNAIHDLNDASQCRPHYRPDTWVPHSTLGMQIRDDARTQALSFANTPIKPFEVLFDTADCVGYEPVRVIEEFSLGSPSKP